MTIPNGPSPQLILASASPRRREILENLGFKFRVHPSRLPEPKLKPAESPERYAVRTAQAKAGEVAKRHARGLVVGADTIVVAGRKILGKPSGKQEARDMLRSLNGRWHTVITGMCLIDCASQQARSSATASRVHFRRLSKSELEWYVNTGEYQDKAGAYAIQGYGSLFVDRIEGCYFNIVGFPVSAFVRLCRRMNVVFFDWLR